MSLFIPPNVISQTACRAEPYGCWNRHPAKVALSEVNTADPVFGKCETMEGSAHVTYHINMIKLLDMVFFYDNMEFLSVAQKRFMDVFFKQAGLVDAAIDKNDDNIYKEMYPEYQQLDNFLGSYLGEFDGKSD